MTDHTFPFHHRMTRLSSNIEAGHQPISGGVPLCHTVFFMLLPSLAAYESTAGTSQR